MSKEKTTEEIRLEFIENIHHLVDYWKNQEQCSTKERLNGLAYSILSTLDGCSMNLPAYIVAPLVNEESKQEHIDEDTDYYPENHNSNVKGDISGVLHSVFNSTKKEKIK